MDSIKPLLEYVIKAGNRAAEEQSKVLRNFKSDGSVVTYIDRELNKYLSDAVKNLFPEANLITEEADYAFDRTGKYTFAIDPIDGTDSFSQMMPGWCVSVGLLENNEPAAGIIYAPLWGPSGGTIIFCDIKSDLYLNGSKIAVNSKPDDSEGLQIMSSSKIHRHFNLDNFKGKVRTSGASVINIIAPVIHSSISAAVIVPCSIWDIAAAHAAVKRAGLEFSYYSGKPVDYSDLYNRGLCTDYIITGHSLACEQIKKMLVKKRL